MNIIAIQGNLTNGGEKFITVNGKSIYTNVLAVNTSQNKTMFIKVKGFDKTAEFLATHASKGSKVTISGRLDSNTFEHKGSKATEIVIIINDVSIESKYVEINKELKVTYQNQGAGYNPNQGNNHSNGYNPNQGNNQGNGYIPNQGNNQGTGYNPNRPNYNGNGYVQAQGNYNNNGYVPDQGNYNGNGYNPTPSNNGNGYVQDQSNYNNEYVPDQGNYNGNGYNPTPSNNDNGYVQNQGNGYNSIQGNNNGTGYGQGQQLSEKNSSKNDLDGLEVVNDPVNPFAGI